MDAINLKISRYLAASDYLAQQTRVLKEGDQRRSLSEIDSFTKDERHHRVGPAHGKGVGGDRGGVVDLEEPRFLASIDLVQADIRRVIEQNSPSESLESYASLLQLVSATPDELVSLYGSVSNAWDCLATTKKMLTVPDGQEFAVGSWLVSCVSEAERLIREVVSLSYSYFGNGFLRDSLMMSLRDLEIDIDAERLLDYPSTSEAIAQLIVDYMSQRSGHTLDAAYLLSTELGFAFLGSPPGFSPGLNDVIAGCVGDAGALRDDRASARLRKTAVTGTEKLFRCLLGWRRTVIHTSLYGDPITELRPHLPLFALSPKQLSYMCDFVTAVGLVYCLEVVGALLQAARSDRPTLDSEVMNREWKLAAELRVAHLHMLETRRWALAWSAAGAIQKVGDLDRQLMPRLNGYFARSMMEDGRWWKVEAKEELRNLDIESSRPRYEVLRRSILGQTSRIQPWLDRAIDESDMTLAELEEWPALDGLRGSTQWSGWFRKRYGTPWER